MDAGVKHLSKSQQTDITIIRLWFQIGTRDSVLTRQYCESTHFV